MSRFSLADLMALILLILLIDWYSSLLTKAASLFGIVISFVCLFFCGFCLSFSVCSLLFFVFSLRFSLFVLSSIVACYQPATFETERWIV